MAGGVIANERTCIGNSTVIHLHTLDNVVQDGTEQPIASRINLQSLPHGQTLATQSGLAAAAAGNNTSPAAIHGKVTITSDLFVVPISIYIIWNCSHHKGVVVRRELKLVIYMSGLKQVSVCWNVPNTNFKELYSYDFSHQKCVSNHHILLYASTLVPAIKYINGFIHIYFTAM